MHRSVSHALRLGIVFLGIGCTASPIGDPCVPESIPETGFDDREVYLETSSVQCRTRVCMVYHLQGDPERICGAGVAEPCVEPQELDDQVFCSCRCSIPEGQQANTPLCNCSQGFTCQDDLVTAGSGGEREGVAGGYCVPCYYEGDTRGLDTNVFQECPTGS